MGDSRSGCVIRITLIIYIYSTRPSSSPHFEKLLVFLLRQVNELCIVSRFIEIMSIKLEPDVPDFVMKPENSSKHAVNVYMETHYDYIKKAFCGICEAIQSKFVGMRNHSVMFTKGSTFGFGYSPLDRLPTEFETKLLSQWLSEGWTSVSVSPTDSNLYIQLGSWILPGEFHAMYRRIPFNTPKFVLTTLDQYSPHSIYTRVYTENKDDARALFEAILKKVRTQILMQFHPSTKMASKPTYSFLCNVVANWLGQLGWEVEFRLNGSWKIYAVDIE